MDLFSQTANAIAASADQYLPVEIPVPKPITDASKIMASSLSPPSFPYRHENIDFSEVSLWQAVIVILLQPFIWNCLGRIEYRTRLLSTIFIRPVFGVYALAAWIFVAGVYRDVLFAVAMDAQQTADQLGTLQMQALGAVCLTVGAILVLSSFYQLGFKGTYLGDYFGFLLDKKVTAFPFNVLSNPMYDGSTLAFLGKAILSQSPAGIFLSGWVYVVYRLACVFEESFTQHIYSQKEAEKKKQ